MPIASIPQRAETLQVLRLISEHEPMLMLTGDDEGYGSRWTLSGQQVQPAIARYLMESGFVAEIGKTEFGARKLTLTATGSFVASSVAARSWPAPTGQMTVTVNPAAVSARASCQTRRSNGTDRFSTRIRM